MDLIKIECDVQRTALRTELQSFIFCYTGVSKISIFSETSRPVLMPTQLLDHWVPGPRSQLVKRQGRGADHLPASSARVKNEGNCTSTLPYTFRSCTGSTLLYFFTFTDSKGVS